MVNRNSFDESLAEWLSIPELIGFHRTHNESPVNYLKLHQKVLHKNIYNSVVVYLDTKFWIILRDAAIGKNTDGMELLELLRGLVRKRRIVCVDGVPL